MLALVIAAQVAAAATPLPPSSFIARPRAACGLWEATPVQRTGPRAPAVQRLGDLPKANHELAVLRLDRDGCSIPVVVRYGAEGDGRAGRSGR